MLIISFFWFWKRDAAFPSAALSDQQGGSRSPRGGGGALLWTVTRLHGAGGSGSVSGSQGAPWAALFSRVTEQTARAGARLSLWSSLQGSPSVCPVVNEHIYRPSFSVISLRATHLLWCLRHPWNPASGHLTSERPRAHTSQDTPRVPRGRACPRHPTQLTRLLQGQTG